MNYDTSIAKHYIIQTVVLIVKFYKDLLPVTSLMQIKIITIIIIRKYKA